MNGIYIKQVKYLCSFRSFCSRFQTAPFLRNPFYKQKIGKFPLYMEYEKNPSHPSRSCKLLCANCLCIRGCAVDVIDVKQFC